MIKTQQLKYAYHSEKTFEFPDISCNGGESVLIIGPSGCGKSTLLHLLCGILKPLSGFIQIRDIELNAMSESKKDAFRGEHIGVILQKPHFISSLNVFENLAAFQTLTGKKKNSTFIMELLASIGLEDKCKQQTQTLSQGEAQRLGFARALIQRPSVILADEPTSALDDMNATRVVSILQEHAAAMQSALIIVTHDNRLKSLFTRHISLI